MCVGFCVPRWLAARNHPSPQFKADEFAALSPNQRGASPSPPLRSVCVGGCGVVCAYVFVCVDVWYGAWPCDCARLSVI
jgi:hypothetical protein